MTEGIGSQIRRERKRRGISLRKLAEQLGISAPYLCDIELGRRRISVQTAERLARHGFGSARDWLLAQLDSDIAALQSRRDEVEANFA